MIDSFRGEYAFLSNCHPAQGGIELEGAKYPTVENAFQAAKTPDVEDRKPFETATAAAARRMGKRVQLRSDWDYARVEIMRGLVRTKFAEPEMSTLLLATADEKLVDGNKWHDNYWGICMCPRCKGEKGLNWLGRILMAVRNELSEKK